MGSTFEEVAAQYVGRALQGYGLYEEQRKPGELRYRSHRVGDLVVLVRKDFVNEISLVVWFPSRDLSYTDLEVAHWAGVSLPDMVATDADSERAALMWMADFVRARYRPILSDDAAALLSLNQVKHGLGKRLLHESQKRSAENAARIAAQHGNFRAVIRYLSPFSEEITEEFRSLLDDARERCRNGADPDSNGIN